MNIIKNLKTTSTNKKSSKKKLMRLFNKREAQVCATPQALEDITDPKKIMPKTGDIVENTIDNIPNTEDNEPNSNNDVESDDDDGELHKTELDSTPYSDMLIGRYKYKQNVGKGAFGTVIKVTSTWNNTHRDIRIGDTFAVKIIHNVFKSSAQAKRLLRELRILRILHMHEAIVELCDIIPPPDPKSFKQLYVFVYALPDT